MITIISDQGSIELDAVLQRTSTKSVVLPASPIAGGSEIVDDIQVQLPTFQLEAIVSEGVLALIAPLLEADGFLELIGPTVHEDTLRLESLSYTKDARDLLPISLLFKKMQVAEIATVSVELRQKPMRRLKDQGKQKGAEVSSENLPPKSKSLLARIRDSNAVGKVFDSLP